MPETRNLSPEELDAFIRKYQNAARRASYARHPERVMRQRLTSAVNLLTKHGLIDDQIRGSILSRIGGEVTA